MGGAKIMGILNVTPDSFSDGGHYFSPDKALLRALDMVKEGADIIDVGGESTRPGSDPVTADEEIQRTLPVIKRIRAESPVTLSIDTQKSIVAAQALEAGANMINDVSAGLTDPEMIAVLKKYQVPYVLMHLRGKPKTMQDNLHYDDLIGEIANFLEDRIHFLVGQGIARERLIIDPGIGFGKTVQQNFQILRELPRFQKLGCPILIGLSQKSFLETVAGHKAGDRVIESVVANFYAAWQGASILRVHNVAETRRALQLGLILTH